MKVKSRRPLKLHYFFLFIIVKQEEHMTGLTSVYVFIDNAASTGQDKVRASEKMITLLENMDTVKWKVFIFTGCLFSYIFR